MNSRVRRKLIRSVSDWAFASEVTSVWAANEAVSVIRAVNFMSYRDLCLFFFLIPSRFLLIIVILPDSNLTDS